MDLTNIINGIESNEGKAIRRFIRDLTTREAAGRNPGAEALDPGTELSNTRIFIEQVVNSVMDNHSDTLNKSTVKPLPPDKLRELVNTAAEKAIILPLHAQLMCFAMTQV